MDTCLAKKDAFIFTLPGKGEEIVYRKDGELKRKRKDLKVTTFSQNPQKWLDWEIAHGNVDERFAAIEPEAVEMPCGDCLWCRLKHSYGWSVRSTFEAMAHKENCFVTLTFDPESLYSEERPGYTVDLRDFTLFRKRIWKHIHKLDRKAHNKAQQIADDQGVQIQPYQKRKLKYFLAAEYGGKTGRPHYHVLIFGWEPAVMVTRGETLLNPQYPIDPAYEEAEIHRRAQKLLPKGVCHEQLTQGFSKLAGEHQAGVKRPGANSKGKPTYNVSPIVDQNWIDVEKKKRLKYVTDDTEARLIMPKGTTTVEPLNAATAGYVCQYANKKNRELVWPQLRAEIEDTIHAQMSPEEYSEVQGSLNRLTARINSEQIADSNAEYLTDQLMILGVMQTGKDAPPVEIQAEQYADKFMPYEAWEELTEYELSVFRLWREANIPEAEWRQYCRRQMWQDPEQKIRYGRARLYREAVKKSSRIVTEAERLPPQPAFRFTEYFNPEDERQIPFSRTESKLVKYQTRTSAQERNAFRRFSREKAAQAFREVLTNQPILARVIAATGSETGQEWDLVAANPSGEDLALRSRIDQALIPVNETEAAAFKEAKHRHRMYTLAFKTEFHTMSTGEAIGKGALNPDNPTETIFHKTKQNGIDRIGVKLPIKEPLKKGQLPPIGAIPPFYWVELEKIDPELKAELHKQYVQLTLEYLELPDTKRLQAPQFRIKRAEEQIEKQRRTFDDEHY